MASDFSTLKVGDKVIRCWGFTRHDIQERVATVTRLTPQRIYTESPVMLAGKTVMVESIYGRVQGCQSGGFIPSWIETATPERIAQVEADTR